MNYPPSPAIGGASAGLISSDCFRNRLNRPLRELVAGGQPHQYPSRGDGAEVGRLRTTGLVARSETLPLAPHCGSSGEGTDEAPSS